MLSGLQAIHEHVLSLLANFDEEDGNEDPLDGEGPDEPAYYGKDDVTKAPAS
jgi:hypothetical protein